MIILVAHDDMAPLWDLHPDQCPHCEGTGQTPFSDPFDSDPCRACMGTGRVGAGTLDLFEEAAQ